MSNFVVRYCKPVPRTLREWCDAHAHQIQEVDAGVGYAVDTRKGFAYDLLLRPGWSMDGDSVHTIIEPTIQSTLAQLRTLSPCDCDQCKDELARQSTTWSRG